jgi:hypothetical protein
LAREEVRNLMYPESEFAWTYVSLRVSFQAGGRSAMVVERQKMEVSVG